MPIEFRKSKAKNKKYAVTYNNKTINFGDTFSSQWRDSTILGLYRHLDNNDIKKERHLEQGFQK